jgi:hypothetical protein
MRTVPIGASNMGAFSVECFKSAEPTALHLHSKCCILGNDLKNKSTGESVEKVQMAISVNFRIVKIQLLTSSRRSINDQIEGFSTVSEVMDSPPYNACRVKSYLSPIDQHTFNALRVTGIPVKSSSLPSQTFHYVVMSSWK